MKTKTKILAFVSLILSVIFIGTGFSIFVFANKINEHTDYAKGLMDDIDVNYKLDANAYTVYFFSSPKWANYIHDNPRSATQSLDDYLSVDSYKNYLKSKVVTNSDKTNSMITNPSDDDIAKIYGYFPDEDTTDIGTYGYKVRYADTCISTNTFNEITTPTTMGRDRYKYRLLFVGWTANIDSAMKSGYNAQGNYDYVSAYDELALLDKESNDGNDSEDKVVFLYPVYTAGKDYDASSKQSVVRLHNRETKILRDNDGNELDWNGNPTTSSSNLGVYFSEELYFSQNTTQGEYNNSYYFYKNLKVGEDEQYYLDFALSKEGGSWGGDWYNFWDGNSINTRGNGIWDGEFKDTDDYKTNLNNNTRREFRPLFDTTGQNKKEEHKSAVNDSGVYNIYVYIHDEGTSYIQDSSAKYESTDMSDEFEKIQLSNSSLVFYEDPNDSVTQVSSWYSAHGDFFKVYVKIEKIMEAGLSGGRTKTLQYDAALQLNKSSNILPSGTTRASSSDVVTSGSASRYYILNNVFLEGNDIAEEILSYNNQNGEEYKYPSDATAVLSNDGKPINVSKMSDAELATFNEGYKTIYGDKYYDFTASGKNKYTITNTAAIKNEVNNLPFPKGSYTDDDMIFINPETSGFYSVVAKLTLTAERVSGNIPNGSGQAEDHHYCTVSFTSCEVGLAFGHSIFANVYLYKGKMNENKTIEKIKLDSGGKFIDVSETGNWYAKSKDESLHYGKPMGYESVFEVREGTTTVEKTLGEILGVSGTTSKYHLTNHLTGREFRFTNGSSINMRRNYAFYIMDGAWQEGELK